ncbi:hypothetical protein BH11PLA2_BH11PLA2_34050 [soil metagenome]
MPDPILIRCPHCQKPVNLPEDYLGKVVSCLECLAPFRAPVRDGDTLTEPQPIAKSRGVPAKLFIPLFGMLLLGTAGLLVNGFLLSDRAAADSLTRKTVESLMDLDPPEKKEWKEADKIKKPNMDELQRRQDVSDNYRKEMNRKIDENIALVPEAVKVRYFGLVTSGLVLLGGLSFLVHRGYPLAFLGCAASVVMSPDLGCCFPGLILAIWGVLALISDEGRRYFGKVTV